MISTSFPSSFASNKVDKILYVMTELGCIGWVSFHIKLKGRIDESNLRRAMELAMRAEPILACRFEPEGRARWEHPGKIESDRSVTVIPTEQPEQDALRQAVSPYDFSAPIVRITIFRSTAPSDYLLFQVSHFLADAAGALQILELLSTNYANAQSDPLPRHNYDWKFPLYQKLDWKDKVRLLTQAIAYPAAQIGEFKKISRCLRADPARVFDANAASQPMIVKHTIAEEEFRKIKTAAFRSQCWLHDAIMAAFLRAFSAFAPPVAGDRHRASMVVNVRRVLPEGYSPPICNLVYPHIVDAGPDLGETFQDTLSRVKEQNRQLEDPIFILRDRPVAFRLMGLASIGSLRKSLRSGIERGCVHGAPPTISNVGTIDPKVARFGGNEAEEFFVSGHPTRIPGFLVTVSEFRGRCSFTVAFYGSEIDPQRVKGLFDQIQAELLALEQPSTVRK